MRNDLPNRIGLQDPLLPEITVKAVVLGILLRRISWSNILANKRVARHCKDGELLFGIIKKAQLFTAVLYIENVTKKKV